MSEPERPRLTGQQVRQVRKVLGLTSEGLGERVGVRSDTVRKWESGRYSIPYGVRADLVTVAQDRIAEIQDAVTALLSAP